MVKELRESTGGGIMDCKHALVEAGGDTDKAGAILRKSGLAKAARRSDRATKQGVVDAYIHPGRPLGALIELGCETDFVARTEEFRTLAHEIAMHVAAMGPDRIDADDESDGETLLDQAYVRDPGRTIGELIQETIARTGENVRVTRFSRFEVGT
jgi:elongation factor Ts